MARCGQTRDDFFHPARSILLKGLRPFWDLSIIKTRTPLLMRPLLYHYLGYLKGVTFNGSKYRKHLLKLFKGDRKPVLQYAENLLKTPPAWCRCPCGLLDGAGGEQ